MVGYRGYDIEQTQRHTTQGPMSVWRIKKNGVYVAGSGTHFTFADARREVDYLKGPHAEPVDDGPRNDPHYD